MKIFYYFRELNTPMYWWQRIHFFNELARTGLADIISFNPLNYETIDEANEKVLPEILAQKDIDIFLTCVDSTWLYPSTIEKVKRIGIPTILVCWDNLELPFKHKSIAPLFDLVWLTSNETRYLFEQWGCTNIVFQTYAANPYAQTPNWNQTIPTVGFIGSPYGSRANKLNLLIDNAINCSVYSDTLFNRNYNTSVGRKKTDIKDIYIKTTRYLRFPIGKKVLYSTIINKFKKNAQLNLNSPNITKKNSVTDEEMNVLYSNFAISLNITELRDTYILKNPIHKIHLRTFEIPMCGGLELVSYNEELAGYFSEDREIVMYRSQDEMLDKCRFYLNPKNDTVVKKIKAAARQRAQNDHTWSIRFQNLLNKL